MIEVIAIKKNTKKFLADTHQNHTDEDKKAEWEMWGEWSECSKFISFFKN